jgi:hypothetical protein
MDYHPPVVVKRAWLWMPISFSMEHLRRLASPRYSSRIVAPALSQFFNACSPSRAESRDSKKPNIPCSWIITLGTQSLSLEGGWHTSKKIHEQRSEICDDPRGSEKAIVLVSVFNIKHVLVQGGAIYYVGVLRVQTVHSTTYIEYHTG